MPDFRDLFRAFVAKSRAASTVRPTPAGPDTTPTPKAPTLLDRRLFRSKQALIVERLLRLGAALATLALFFVALSWLDLWRPAPVEARMVGVGLFGSLALYLIAREIMRGWPSRASAVQRLDAAAAAPLRPARSLDDTLAAKNADPATRALWELHRQRLEATLAETPIAAPAPQLARLDPFALRALALVAAVAAGFVAGDEKGARLAAAIDWRAGDRLLGASDRIDAWFEPPAYTGRPAIVLGSGGRRRRGSAGRAAAPASGDDAGFRRWRAGAGADRNIRCGSAAKNRRHAGVSTDRSGATDAGRRTSFRGDGDPGPAAAGRADRAAAQQYARFNDARL